jgi:hypothetical protein
VFDWRIYLHTGLADWLLSNPCRLGGPGLFVKVDEAKFGKRKYNKGSYREGKWVLGGVILFFNHLSSFETYLITSIFCFSFRQV